jgi:hypothetical protein
LLAASTFNRTGGTPMMTDNGNETQRVIGGIDTHKDVHVAALLDELGRLLGTLVRNHDDGLSATAPLALRSG